MAGPGANSVAVLYFDNLSRDTSLTYLADGLTEEVIATLGKIRRLEVKSLFASQQFRGRQTGSPAAVGRALGAAYLLRGSVRPAAGQVRVTYELLRAATGAHVAGDLLERSSTDLAGVPGELAAAIATALLGTLRPEERAILSRLPTRNAEAHDLYLRALHASASWAQQGPRVALAYLDRAIALDSSYAPAWAAKAVAWNVLADAFMPGGEANVQSRAAAQRALQLDSSLALAWAMLSSAAFVIDHDSKRATELARRAVQMDPREKWGHITLGVALIDEGRHRDGLAEARRGWEVDTLDAFAGAVYLWCLYQTGQRDTLAAMLPRLTGALAAEDAQAYRGLLSLLRGDHAAAGRDLTWTYYGGLMAGEYVQTQLALGRRDGARAAVDSMLATRASGFFNPYAIARSFAALGERDSAFVWLEHAYREQTQWLQFMPTDPVLAPLRADPRFAALLRRQGWTP